MGAQEDLELSAPMTRRRLLQLTAAASVMAVAGCERVERDRGAGPPRGTTDTTDPSREPLDADLSRWSDPAAWGGRIPGEGDVAIVSRPVLLDVDVRVAGATIDPGGALYFDRAQSRTLETTGNVIVQGRLEMAPSTAAVTHRLVFVSVDEAAFTGGGSEVLASDIGLWVMGEGVLDTAGAPKTAWVRTAESVAKGARTLNLDREPSGWRVGDEIVLTPTLSPAIQAHWQAYDLATVSAIEGRVITIAGPTSFEHPAVTASDGAVLGSEVLNLTRNVAIEGTAGGRSHVFVKSTRALTVRYTTLRHLGPRRAKGRDSGFVPGRYALHLHLAGEGTRDSVIEGAVGRDCGSHTFVTHGSHGVTWRSCISHDTVEDPYWWDPPDKEKGIAVVPSDDVLYEGCVASLVRAGSDKDFHLAGFFLGAGTGNAARGCVAVGIAGKDESSGYIWPSNSQGLWTFEDCVAHNNRRNGIFVWQNTDRPHVISRFTGYHNGTYGIHHGAYLNRYLYDGGVLYGNGEGAVNVKALSKADAGGLRFVGLRCDAAQLSDFAVISVRHVLPSRGPVEFVRCSFSGYRVAAVGFLGGGTAPHVFDLVGNHYDANEFHLSSSIPPGSRIRVQDDVHGPLALERVDGAGALNERWNARVSPIPPPLGSELSTVRPLFRLT